MVAEIDTAELTVSRHVTIETAFPEAYMNMPMAASTKAGRIFLAGNNTVYALDTDTLEPTMGWSTGSELSTIDDIRVSQDATELWVLTGRKVRIVNLSSMKVTHEIVAPLPGREPVFAKTDGGEGGFTDIGDFFCAC
jgi:hypothetical protein